MPNALEKRNERRFVTYQDQLKDERWKRKRLKILQYADHRCQTCGAQNISLQVHHSYYISGAMAWEYPDGSLVALCDDCHGRVVHGIKNYNDWAEDKELWFLEKATVNIVSCCKALKASRVIEKQCNLNSLDSEFVDCLVGGTISSAVVIYMTAISLMKREKSFGYPIELTNSLEQQPEKVDEILTKFEVVSLGKNYFMPHLAK